MIIISHRGNVNGPEPNRENSPDYIDEALEAGYQVEIDLHVKDGKFYLGHDGPVHEVSKDWLYFRRDSIWIRAKNYEAAVHLVNELNFCRWFAHERDRYCLTSCGYIWLHDRTVKETTDCIVPLLSMLDIYDHSYIISHRSAHAICTDYPEYIRDVLIKESK